MVSTRIDSANFSLIPSRALQTLQMKLEFRARSLIFCCSKTPNSRSRSDISGLVMSCLMQTTDPASTWLNGQIEPPAHWPSRTRTGCVGSRFTAGKLA
jgi:hypothetical protein